MYTSVQVILQMTLYGNKENSMLFRFETIQSSI